MKFFGSYLKQLRLLKGDSLEAATSALDVEQHLLAIEKGLINPTKMEIIRFANYFGVPEKELLIRFLDERINSVRSENKKILTGNYVTSFEKNKTNATKRIENMMYELLLLKRGNIDLKFYKPGYPLSHLVENIIYYEGSALYYDHEKILPDGTVKLFISLDDEKHILFEGNSRHSHSTFNGAWIIGIQKKSITHYINKFERTICVHFRLSGFYGLTGIPQTEFDGSLKKAEDLFGPSILHLRERLIACNDVAQIFQAVDDYLTGQIKGFDHNISVLQYIYNNIEKPISELARKSGYSQKHIIHLFKNHTGLTPKYYQRISRFNKVLNALHTSDHSQDWQTITFINNYYDQAHLIKEFNHFSDTNPRAYLQAGATCPKFIQFRSNSM